MKVNFNTYNQKSFTAKFSNDEQTVNILKKQAKDRPMVTKLVIDTLKEAGTNDIVSLKSYKNHGRNTIVITNESIDLINPLLDGREECSEYKLFGGIQNLLLSNGKYVSSAMAKLARLPEHTSKRVLNERLLKDYIDKCNTPFDKLILKKEKEIENLKNEILELQTKKYEYNVEHISKYIDENV